MRIMQRTLAFNMRLPTHAMPISIFIRNAYADVTRTYPRKIQEWASNWWEPGKETMHDGSDGGFGGDGKKSLAPSQPTPGPLCRFAYEVPRPSVPACGCLSIPRHTDAHRNAWRVWRVQGTRADAWTRMPGGSCKTSIISRWKACLKPIKLQVKSFESSRLPPPGAGHWALGAGHLWNPIMRWRKTN